MQEFQLYRVKCYKNYIGKFSNGNLVWFLSRGVVISFFFFLLQEILGCVSGICQDIQSLRLGFGVGQRLVFKVSLLLLWWFLVINCLRLRQSRGWSRVGGLRWLTICMYAYGEDSVSLEFRTWRVVVWTAQLMYTVR